MIHTLSKWSQVKTLYCTLQNIFCALNNIYALICCTDEDGRYYYMYYPCWNNFSRDNSFESLTQLSATIIHQMYTLYFVDNETYYILHVDNVHFYFIVMTVQSYAFKPPYFMHS